MGGIKCIKTKGQPVNRLLSSSAIEKKKSKKCKKQNKIFITALQ